MALTPAQNQTLKANIAANVNTVIYLNVATPINAVPNTTDGNIAVAGWYNLATAAYWVWRTNISTDDVNNAVDWSEVVALSTNNLLAFDALKQQSKINASLTSIRNAFAQIFKQATSPNSLAALTAAAKRLALNVEQVFATGTGSNASPSTMGYEGTVSGQDIETARNS